MSSPRMTTLEAASRMARIGIASIPIPLGTKGPKIKNWPKVASTDPDVLSDFFGHGGTGIGLVTGAKSAVFAVDVDRKSNGLQTLKELFEIQGEFPATPTQITGGGGLHFLFRLPEGVSIKSRAAVAPGIDVRGEPGVIVVEPSLHESGNRYLWRQGQAPWELPPADPPEWLLNLVGSPQSSRPERKSPGQKSKRLIVDPDAVQDFKEVEAQAASVAAGCAAIEQAYESPDEISEFQWKMTLSVLARCKDGRRLSHYMSSLDTDRYSEMDTDRAIDRVLHEMDGPYTCEAFAKEASGACAQCAFRHTLTTPLQLGREEERLVRLQRNFVYVADEDHYFDLGKQIYKKSRDFSATFAHKLKGASAHQAFITSKTAPKVDQTKYIPGRRERVVKDAKGVLVANSYIFDGVEAAEGDWSIWKEHFEYLLPNNEGERDHLLNVMACTLQRPEKKIRHAILIKGGQRTGKSSIGNAWAAMLGESNVVKVSAGELESSFQGGIFNKQLAVLEELFVKGRDRYNDLKEFISEDEQRAQRKNIDFYRAQTPRAILALSNRDLPIMLPEADDARWFIIQSEAKPQQREYYDRLHAEGANQIAAFKAALLLRDLSTFNQNSPPQTTEAKRLMVADSRSPVDHAVMQVLERTRTPIVIPEEIARLSEVLNVKGSVSQVRDALRKVGAQPLGQVRFGERRVSPWVWKDVDRWAYADAQEIKAVLSKGRCSTFAEEGEYTNV